MKDLGIVFLITTILTGSVSLARGACEPLQYEKQVLDIYQISAKQYQADVSAYTTMSKEADLKMYTSAGLAITSGVLLLSGSALSLQAMVAPAFIETIQEIRIAMGFVLGIPLAGLTGPAFPIFVKPIMYMVGHLDASLMIANGIYQITANGKKAVINLNDLSATEDKIKSAIIVADDYIRNLVTDPPGRIANTLALGGKNARHYEAIRNYSELRMRLTNDLVTLQSTKVKVLESACGQ